MKIKHPHFISNNTEHSMMRLDLRKFKHPCSITYYDVLDKYLKRLKTCYKREDKVALKAQLKLIKTVFYYELNNIIKRYMERFLKAYKIIFDVDGEIVYSPDGIPMLKQIVWDIGLKQPIAKYSACFDGELVEVCAAYKFIERRKYDHTCSYVRLDGHVQKGINFVDSRTIRPYYGESKYSGLVKKYQIVK